MEKTLVSQLAGYISARLNCIERNNENWQYKHEKTIEDIVDKLPSGSGIDSGNNLDFEKSTPEKIVINSSFHTMDEWGGYSGWIDYRLVITASLQFGFNINIIGNFSSNKNAYGLKDYLQEIYDFSLSEIYTAK